MFAVLSAGRSFGVLFEAQLDVVVSLEAAIAIVQYALLIIHKRRVLVNPVSM